MAEHLIQVGVAVAGYAVLAVCFLGYGLALTKLLGTRNPHRSDLCLPIWLGWAVFLFLLQLVHLVLPLTAAVVLPVLGAGLVAAWVFRHEVRGWRVWRRLPRGVMLLLAGVLAAYAVWVTHKVMLAPKLYDAGLYHLNTIRWANTYPIVPGLGNLHIRLGFNSSYSLFAAALNFHPWFGHGGSYGNAFLILLAMATFLPHALVVLHRPLRLRDWHPLRYLPGVFLSPVVLHYSLDTLFVPSPSPFVATVLIQLVLFYVLARGFGEWLDGRTRQRYLSAALLILAAAAVTVKLSNGVPAVVLGCFVLAYLLKYQRRSWRAWAAVMLPPLAMAVLWMSRTFILTGAPLFPSMVGWTSVDWAVPPKSIVGVQEAIVAWSRQPRTPREEVLGTWKWLGPWWHRMREMKVRLIYPAQAAGVCLLLAGALHAWFRRKPSWEWLLLVLPVVGFVFWFFTAPGWRFFYGLSFVLMVSSACLLLALLRRNLSRRVYLAAVLVVFLAGQFRIVEQMIDRPRGLAKVSWTGWQSAKTVPLITKTTDSGLEVRVPVEGNQCWDAPLPCAPGLNRRLRLRKAGDLSSGFTVTAPEAGDEPESPRPAESVDPCSPPPAGSPDRSGDKEVGGDPL